MRGNVRKEVKTATIDLYMHARYLDYSQEDRKQEKVEGGVKLQ